MQTRSRNALFLALFVALAVAALVWVAQHQKTTSQPLRALDAIPDGAMLVATADMSALRASPAAAPFLQKGREIEGVGSVRAVCGFDPIDLASEIAFAIPATGDPGDFGLAASGAFDDSAVISCASKIISMRGGRPVVTTIGGFQAVRDVSSNMGGEIAVRPGGPLLFGAGAYLRAMIDAADGRAPSVRASETHAAMARAIGDSTVTATFVLTPEQRQALAEELASAGTPDAPIASVVAGGLGARMGGAVDLHGVLACNDAGGCARVAVSLKERRDAAAASTTLRLLGLGALLEQLSIEPEGARVHARVKVPVEDARALVERIMALRALDSGDKAAPPPDATSTPDAGQTPMDMGDAGADAH